MPIMSRTKMNLHGKDFVYKLGYRPQRDKMEFYIPLPDYMGDLLGYSEIKASTQLKVEIKWHDTLDEYDKRASTLEKVIFYRFLSRIMPYGTPQRGFMGLSADQGKGEMISPGVALDLWFLVGYVVHIPSGEKDYLDANKKKVGARNNTVWGYMEWTKEREVFFHGFRKMLEGQIEKMHEFFYKDRAGVPALIDLGMTGRKFLPHLEEKG